MQEGIRILWTFDHGYSFSWRRRLKMNDKSRRQGRKASRIAFLLTAFCLGYAVDLWIDQVEAAHPEGSFSAERDKAFFVAVRKGNLTMVDLLLAQGSAADQIEKDTGLTPLTIALKKGNLEIVRTLLAHGARVNRIDASRKTPIMIASEASNPAIVKLLIQSGANVNTKMEFGMTPLMLAVEKGRTDVVRVLIQNGASVTASTKDGTTVLMIAAFEGDPEIVRMLLSSGGSGHVKGRMSPIMIAALNGHIQAMNELIGWVPGIVCIGLSLAGLFFWPFFRLRYEDRKRNASSLKHLFQIQLVIYLILSLVLFAAQHELAPGLVMIGYGFFVSLACIFLASSAALFFLAIRNLGRGQ